MELLTLQTNILIKATLAVLLFICLWRMPYGYYQFVRFAAAAVFVLLAMTEKPGPSQKVHQAVYIALAILFQPLIKIALGRTIWNIVDVIVGVGLIVSIFFLNGRDKKPEANEFIRQDISKNT